MEETAFFVLGVVFALSLLIGCFQFLEERHLNPRPISEGPKGSAPMEKAPASEGEWVRHGTL